MITVACPVCRTRCRLPGDAHPREPFACPDCGEVSSIPNLPAYNTRPVLEWAVDGAPAIEARSLGRYDPVGAEPPPYVPYSPAVTTGTAWGLALVAMFGVVTGFMGYFVTAKHIAPALKAQAAQHAAAQ